MLQVKYELCGGNQAFAMGFKDGIVREFVTQPAESNITGNRYIETAVQEKAFPDAFPVKLSVPVLEPDISRMRTMLNQEYVDWKREFADSGFSSGIIVHFVQIAISPMGCKTCEFCFVSKGLMLNPQTL